MLKTELNTLQIRLLLHCADAPMSRSNFAKICQSYRRQYTKEQCEEALSSLLQHEFLITKEMPKRNAKKTPVFYFITAIGNDWVTDYETNYPKS